MAYTLQILSSLRNHRAPIPVRRLVSQPSGVCKLELREPGPEPKASGFADWYDCFRASKVWCAEE